MWRRHRVDALWTYLRAGAANGLVDSGYVEYAESEDRYVYTYSPAYDSTMIATMIVVERGGDGAWRVTEQYNSGC